MLKSSKKEVRKMEVLFATKNPAKVKRYVSRLQDKGIEILTLKDINVELDVQETGKNAIENAYLKAKAYFEAKEGKKCNPFEVNIKADKLLRKFILSGGFEVD